MFTVYPVIDYNSEKIIDISRRFAIKNIESPRSADIYFWHTIKNWKSPENIAYDFYGSCDYVWVILALNNIVNPYEDWLFSDEELRSRIQKKYGSKIEEPHHYEMGGILYTELPAIEHSENVKIITNYEYEVNENEKRRMIKVLYPNLLSKIESEVRALFK